VRGRNREINIFNMSLLDILCGALGAFCFMMLTLFPYYNRKDAAPTPPPAPMPPAGNYEEAQRQLKKAEQQMNDLYAKLKQAEQQLNRTRAELDQQKQRTKDLENRNPLAVQIWWGSARHDVDLFIKDEFKSKQGGMMPGFDPAKKQGPFWPGDASVDHKSGPGSEMWLLRDVPPGTYKVYYKLLNDNGNPGPAFVFGAYLHEGAMTRLPGVTLTPQKRSMFVGTITAQADRKLAFSPSAEARTEMDRQKGQ
jgi:hypothetical protein